MLLEGVKFLTQVRWKPEKSPQYTGMLEIPAGTMDAYEDVYETLKREIKEETNLDIINIYNNYKSEIYETRKDDVAFVFKPFLCQQVLKTNGGLPWVGFVFLCEVEGEAISQATETKDPKWNTIDELEEIILQKGNIFVLQVPPSGLRRNGGRRRRRL